MINAVTNTSAAAGPAGAAARPAGHEAAVRVAAAPTPHAAPAAAGHESTVVTISAQAARTAQLAQPAPVAHGPAHAAVAQGKAPAPAPAGQAGAPAASEHAAPTQTAAPTPRIHAAYFSPTPAPLSLDPIPSQHLPAIAFSPADANKDGHVSSDERESYDFHHAPSLAAQPGEAEANLSAYTSIAGS